MMDKGTILEFYNDLDTDQIICITVSAAANLEEMAILSNLKILILQRGKAW